MPLTLVLGPANAAKAGEVLQAFAAAAHRGALLVVPTAVDADHYARELAADGVVFHRVTTFAGLAREIAARTGYAAPRLSGLQRELVLRRAIGRLALTALGGSSRTPGFTVAAGRLVAELQRTLVTPQRFTSALRAWARAGDGRDGYAEDLAAIYSAYARELERIGRVDDELFAWRALDRLRGRPGAWGTAPVFFYGFDDLLGIERDAIETLARIVGVEVTVSLTYEPGRAALAARARAAEDLRAIASEVRELPALDEHYAPEARAALHHLERGLFEREPGRVDAGGAVRLLEAAGERAEAELIAAEILGLLRDGAEAGEIVVVTRSLAAGGPLLGAVLDSYGIPWGSEGRTLLVHTALGRGLLALARCALGDGGADELVRYLRTPGLLEHPEVVDALEAAILREGLRTAAQARERLGWTLGELDSLRDADDLGQELLRQARRLLAAPRRGRAAVLSDAEELDARALAGLADALGELAELGERLTPVDALALLQSLELPSGTAPHDGAVLIAEPLGIRARRFRAVFVCGLCEGEFPRATAPEPFLSDERRRELALASGLILAQREDWLTPERYLLYSSVSRATDRVTLSFRSSDEDGNVVLPSPFLADVVELFDASLYDRRRRRLLADVTWPLQQAPTDRELARARATCPPARGPEPPPERRLSGVALRHVRHREVVSGSALESFAGCPVRWLVEGELRPDVLAPDPEPLSRGSFMHAALERVIERLGGPVTPASLPLAEQLLAEVLGELESDDDERLAPGRPEPLRRALLRSIEADLRRYLAVEAADGCEFVPRGLELRFGFSGEDSLPAITLGEGEDQVRLRGVIDRVDVDPAGGRAAIVRDYKSGSSRPAQQSSHWLDEHSLQVALYMVAVRELLELDPVAGFYQPLGGRELRARGAYRTGAPVGTRVYAGDGREADELSELLDGAVADAAELARRLRSGVLEPCPQTCSRDGCRYPGICRSS
jgi:ATP-dependent helicase/DNAse subunit B